MSIYEEFISKFPEGIRANLFKVYIDDLPPMFVKNMTIPGVTLNTYTLFYNQFLQEYVTSQDFDPITMNFYLDSDHLTVFKKFMIEWKNKIVDWKTGQVGYKEDYTKDIIIHVLDSKGNVKLKTTLIESWPINIEPLSFDYEMTNTFITVPVTFRFENIEFEVLA